MWKKLVRDYFTFTKKERVAVVILICITLSVSVIPHWFPTAEENFDELAWRRFMEEAARLKPAGVAQQYRYSDSSADRTNNVRQGAEKNAELFPFDPNTLPPAGWEKLGLRPGTIRTIQNYIARGGRFVKPSDIGKIYGFRPEEVKALIPFVRIAGRSGNPEEGTRSQPEIKKDGFYNADKNRLTVINVNEADTAAWIRFPGIGSKLAFRIVQFRTKLGGFYAVEQVKETYGLPDSVFQKIRPWLSISGTKPVPVNINTAGMEELRQHPYIRWHLANAIVQYRGQHGNFRSARELERIAIVDSGKLVKLLPYLVVE